MVFVNTFSLLRPSLSTPSGRSLSIRHGREAHLIGASLLSVAPGKTHGVMRKGRIDCQRLPIISAACTAHVLKGEGGPQGAFFSPLADKKSGWRNPTSGSNRATDLKKGKGVRQVIRADGNDFSLETFRRPLVSGTRGEPRGEEGGTRGLSLFFFPAFTHFLRPSVESELRIPGPDPRSSQERRM